MSPTDPRFRRGIFRLKSVGLGWGNAPRSRRGSSRARGSRRNANHCINFYIVLYIPQSSLGAELECFQQAPGVGCLFRRPSAVTDRISGLEALG